MLMVSPTLLVSMSMASHLPVVCGRTGEKPTPDLPREGNIDAGPLGVAPASGTRRVVLRSKIMTAKTRKTRRRIRDELKAMLAGPRRDPVRVECARLRLPKRTRSPPASH